MPVSCPCLGFGQAGRKKFEKTKSATLTFQAKWHGLKERRAMDPKQWEQCHNAVLTLRSVFEKYQGQKQRRKGSFEREKLGDYGALHGPTGEPFASMAATQALLAKHAQQKLVFGAGVIKVNINKIKQVSGGRLVGWLVGWSVGRSVGRLVGWSDARV